MANITWIVKIANCTGKSIRYIDGEDPKRTGIIDPNPLKFPNFEGSGFCFPWVDINKGELYKAIKFYDATSNAFLFQVYQSWNRDRLEWTVKENASDAQAIVLSNDSTTGDRKAIVIDQTFTPKVFNQYPNYTRYQPYINNWMGFTHHEYYKNSPGDTGLSGVNASDFMTEMWNELKYPNGPNFLEQDGPFRGYQMESWHIDISTYIMDQKDWGIEYSSGLTLPWKTLVNTKGPIPDRYGSVVSHEFGHQYQNSLTKNNATGALLLQQYKQMRQVDFTKNTPFEERFAEDFRFFFGVVGICGHLHPDDDYNKPGSTVRHPNSVKGLKDWMRGSWPMANYLNGHNCNNFSYKDSWFQWYCNNRWEGFHGGDGIFYYHNGKDWIKF